MMIITNINYIDMNPSSGGFDVPDFMLRMSPWVPWSPLYDARNDPQTQNWSVVVTKDEKQPNVHGPDCPSAGPVVLASLLIWSVVAGILLFRKDSTKR
jgi:hypothetical protein